MAHLARSAARWSPFDAAQQQVLHCIEADCSARDSVAHRGSNLIGAEYLHQPQRPSRWPKASMFRSGGTAKTATIGTVTIGTVASGSTPTPQLASAQVVSPSAHDSAAA